MKTKTKNKEYRELQLDDIIMAGDEFLLAGCNTDWAKVYDDSIGRTVREQRKRDTNQAWDFRRLINDDCD